MRHVLVVRRRRLAQKWHGRFVADNGLVLASTERYANEKDLRSMLGKYFPGWEVRS